MSTTSQRVSRKKDTGKIGKLIRLLGSDKDGEVLAAVGALRRALRADGRDLHDLADAVALWLNQLPPAPEPAPQRSWSRSSYAPPNPDPDNWETMCWYLHYFRFQLRKEDREKVADYLLGVGFFEGRCTEGDLRYLRRLVASVQAAR